MGRDGLPQGRAELQGAGIPAYIFPESAVRALAALERYARWLERPVEAPATFPVRKKDVEGILNAVRTDGREHLTKDEAYGVLEAYGIPVIPHRLARTAAEARDAAETLGFPVVLKVVSPDIVHKSDVGGVRLDLRDPDAVERAYESLLERIGESRPEAEVRGVLIAPFRGDGRELILGMSVDPSFRPVLMFGLGGIHVETFRDVAFRVPPVTEGEAREMVGSIRSFPLLTGTRGEKPVDLDAVVEAIQRLAQLVQEHDSIVEVDVNPFLATPEGALALDARIRLGGVAGEQEPTGSKPP